MHYKIDKNVVIKSENAAKSYTQPNRYLLSLLEEFNNFNYALDYGCGKGRYTSKLCNLANKVDAIDSRIQIHRKQNIWGKQTTLANWAESIPNLAVYSIEDFQFQKEKYDLILNSNVLSAIPKETERIQILRNIKKALTKEGFAIITVQYRNSYFSAYAKRQNAKRFFDGWLIKRQNSYSFYGLINKSKLIAYIENVGLHIVHIRLHDGSVFAIVSK